MNNPIFIIGIGKTGSKLFQEVITNSEEVFIAPEINFDFPFKSCIKKTIENKGSLSSDENIVSVVDAIFDGNIPHSNHYWANTNKPELLSELLKSDRSLRSFFSILIKNIAKNEHGERWGAKFPVHFSRSINMLEWFSDSKVLFIIRNPKAILSSEIKMKAMDTQSNQFPVRKDGFLFKILVFFYVIIQWNQSLRVYRRCKKKFPKRIELFKYEDLITKPESTIQNICNFIGIKYRDGLHDVKVKGSRFELEGQGGFRSENVERWRSKLSSTTIILANILTLRSRKLLKYK